jgi:hypothetical protein
MRPWMRETGKVETKPSMAETLTDRTRDREVLEIIFGQLYLKR